MGAAGIGMVGPPSIELVDRPEVDFADSVGTFSASAVIEVSHGAPQFPTPLDSYPAPSPDGLLATLSARVAADPFNAIATAIFLLAILHTFIAPRFAALAHRVQHAHDDRTRAAGEPARPSVRAEMLHFMGEIEVVFGLWAAVLLIAVTLAEGWEPAKHYFAEGVNYTEPLFVGRDHNARRDAPDHQLRGGGVAARGGPRPWHAPRPGGRRSSPLARWSGRSSPSPRR
jgi:hypothetical protein